MARPRVLTDAERVCNRRAAWTLYRQVHRERVLVRQRAWEIAHRLERNALRRMTYAAARRAEGAHSRKAGTLFSSTPLQAPGPVPEVVALPCPETLAA